MVNEVFTGNSIGHSPEPASASSPLTSGVGAGLRARDVSVVTSGQPRRLEVDLEVGGGRADLSSRSVRSEESSRYHTGEADARHLERLGNDPSRSDGSASYASSQNHEYPADIETGHPAPAASVSRSDSQPAKLNLHALWSASLTQAVATSLSFGLKPFVEVAVEEFIKAAGGDDLPFGGPELSKVLANVAGGAFVAVVHNAVGGSVGAYMAGATGGEVYKDQNNSHGRREINDFIAISLPVITAFTGTYAAGSAVMATASASTQNSSIVAAAARSTQSAVGGAVQGAVTAAIKQLHSDFAATPAEKITLDEAAGRFRANFSKSFNPNDPTVFGKQGAGKLIGSILGMLATSYAGPTAAASFHGSTEGVKSDVGAMAVGGAAGMLAYMAGWFGGAHAGSLAGNAYAEHSAGSVRVSPAPPSSDEDSIV